MTTPKRSLESATYGVQHDTDFVVLNSLKEKRGIVTANLTTPYLLQFTSLKEGPLVVEYPAGMTAGGFIDLWQRPVADTGLTGPDQGKVKPNSMMNSTSSGRCRPISGRFPRSALLSGRKPTRRRT